MAIGRLRWQLPEILVHQEGKEDFSLLTMNTEAIRRRLLTFASQNLPKDGKERLAINHSTLRSSLWNSRKGNRNDNNGIPPAEPLSAVIGFLSQAESSTNGSAARAEILPTGRQWLDDPGRNLCQLPADVSNTLPTSAGGELWLRPTFLRDYLVLPRIRAKIRVTIGDTAVPKQCLRLVR